ncbi:hypothetical protein ACFE04_030527 [Oxalis oulophora]
MQDVLVLYPSAGMGHIVAMVELGKLLLRHNHHPNGVLSYIHKISLTHPSITFLRFPTVTVEPPSLTRSPAAASFEFIRLHAVNARRSLEEISKTSNVRAFIIDMFCTTALSIGKELQIPTYYFYTSGAGAFTAFLHFPALNKEFENQSYKDLTTTVLQFPAAVPPLKATQMPEPMLDRNDLAHRDFSWFCASLPLANGVIINTFEELEVSPVKALLENRCFLDKSKPTPPVYCIGPLIADSEAKLHDCLAWLDAQPKRSVLFLCFGSSGSFTVPQLKQIAEGLERSGVRFLWLDEKSKVMRDLAMAALGESGSSTIALARFVQSWSK